MPCEAFLRKRYAVVRSLDWEAAGSYRGCRNDHIDNHSHSSGQDNGSNCHDHARVGFDLATFDGPIDHAVPPRREAVRIPPRPIMHSPRTSEMPA